MITIGQGNPLIMGCKRIEKSYNFSVTCSAQKVKLLIFDNKNADPTLSFLLDESYKTGNVFSCKIHGINLDRYLYCYETVKDKPVRFLDPYAKTLTDCETYRVEQESPKYLSRVALDTFNWKQDKHPFIAYEDCIIYKLNVRGFTKSKTSGVRHKGTFKGIIEKIPYLLKLGITTIELMPAYEFDEVQRFVAPRSRQYTLGMRLGTQTMPVNYWGYTEGYYFAPKASFSSCAHTRMDYTVEFKQMVSSLHEAGLEVLMEMYMPEASQTFVLDCLRYWITEYHVDGFHLYANTAAIQAVATDPVLSTTKIMADYWNGEITGYSNMANYNTGFETVARRFLKGDENQLMDFVRVARNNPLHCAAINYITNHNGFTMMDLVSYDRKHNEANGENNRDGEDFNYSWNCGVEGKSGKRKIADLRQRQIKNALMLVMLSQGTPLLLAGDEFKNSQQGNNNPYSIDSELSWLNWKKSSDVQEIIDFTSKLIAFRKQQKILHMPKELLASDYRSCGYPDVSYHGTNAWYNAMENFNRHIGIMYCCDYATKENTQNHLIYVAYNLHWEEHTLALPKVGKNMDWNIMFCSGNQQQDIHITSKKEVDLAARTIAVLIASEKKIDESGK